MGRGKAASGTSCDTWAESSREYEIAISVILIAQISSLVAQAANNNPCSLYFLNVLIDTTIGVYIPTSICWYVHECIGVAIFFVALTCITWVFTIRYGLEGFVSGQYGHPPQPILYVLHLTFELTISAGGDNSLRICSRSSR